MSETKYHLFKVYDYKGGELSSNINLSKVKVIKDILETLDTNFYYDNEDTPLTKEEIITHIKDPSNLPEFSEYAGGDDTVAELYYTTLTGDLEEINITEFIKDNASDFASILLGNAEQCSKVIEEDCLDYANAIAINNSRPQALV